MVRLWDRQLVLPRLCRRHLSRAVRLCESAPGACGICAVHRADIWRAALRTEAIVFLFFASVFSFAAVDAGWGLSGVLYGTAAALGLCLIQGGLQLPVLVWMARAALPTLTVSDGTLYIHRRWPRGRRMRVAFPLVEFRWRPGKSRQDTFLRATVVPKVPVILLIHGPGRWGYLFQYRIACGWTHEMRRIWSAFLALAALPSA